MGECQVQTWNCCCIIEDLKSFSCKIGDFLRWLNKTHLLICSIELCQGGLVIMLNVFLAQILESSFFCMESMSIWRVLPSPTRETNSSKACLTSNVPKMWKSASTSWPYAICWARATSRRSLHCKVWYPTWLRLLWTSLISAFSQITNASLSFNNLIRSFIFFANVSFFILQTRSSFTNEGLEEFIGASLIFFWLATWASLTPSQVGNLGEVIGDLTLSFYVCFDMWSIKRANCHKIWMWTFMCFIARDLNHNCK